MKIQIYADIVFIINFCMDYILLTIMCKIMVYKSSRRRRICGGAVGAISAIAAFYISSAWGIALQLSTGVLMCLICQPWRKLRDFISRLAVFYAASFILGGSAMAVLCAVGANVLLKNGAFYIDIDIGLLAISTAVGYGIITLLERITKRAKTACRKSVSIGFMGKRADLTGYVDTGNTLTCGGVPVVLISRAAAAPLSPDENSADFPLNCPPEKIRIISYKYIGGNGLLHCIIPDYIYVDGKISRAVIGICPDSLSAEYDALLYAEM